MSYNKKKRRQDEKNHLLRITDLFIAYFFKRCFIGL